MKFITNLKSVPHTATKADAGTLSAMDSEKKMSMMGMLLPAPERPPMFDSVIRMYMRMEPVTSMRKSSGSAKGTLSWSIAMLMTRS